MKPERLEMEGFAPFRDRVSLDFTDLELFALTGPTGAGKSSVIDAVTFALYGSVPRHGRRSVAPAISLGRAETRVSFAFEVEGASYLVARNVQRKPRGGVGTEARLERDGEVLASGSEVTAAVERLLGLGIDHFTRSVVLPQGEFAAFLHDTPAGQQELVKALLDMGVLDRVRTLATERGRARAAVADQARIQLDHLIDATAEAERTATEHLARLEKLVEPVTAAEVAISEGEEKVRMLAVEAQTREREAALLASVSVPEGVTELSSSLQALDDRLKVATEAARAAEESADLLVTESEQVPSLETLKATADLGARLDRAVERRDSIDLPGLEEVLSKAEMAVTEAAASRRQAQADFDAARTRHAAHALVAEMSAGDACPICARPLLEDPAQPPDQLAERQGAAESAESLLEESTSAHRSAETRLAEARAAHQASVESIADIEERLRDMPAPADLEQLSEARQDLDQRLTEARKGLREARQEAAQAEAARSELEGAAARAWDEFTAARDRLAGLQPPPANRDDLSRAWDEFSTWAKSEAEKVGERLAETKAAVEDATASVDKHRKELAQLLLDAGVEGTAKGSTRLAAAVATAEADVERIRERRASREALESDLKRFTEEHEVAAGLGNHLRANQFQGWLLSEALGTLVEGANGLLSDLTSGAYSLALSGGAIEVVDHRNADEHRSVRSLSGGETFLVSLALALSLGEQLTELSDRGGARLEAIFLDEGFGSLDAETLETVTVVVTELAAQGRIVGLVTHVKELAEQMPVRFEVKPGPSGSTVEKVVA